jgi:RimJ/RimL family protein N-acetyltransferase
MSPGSFKEFRSQRLLLRRLQLGDFSPLCRYRSLPEVARYQSWETFTPSDATQLIESQLLQEPNIPGTWFQLAIIVDSTGTMIGDCGLHCRQDDPRQMEIGITLDPTYQGQGYATEAIECLLAYVFGTLGKHRVSAITDAENQTAIGLMKRLGFRQEAHHIDHVWFKGNWGSEFIFALLKREWDQRTRS